MHCGWAGGLTCRQKIAVYTLSLKCNAYTHTYKSKRRRTLAPSLSARNFAPAAISYISSSRRHWIHIHAVVSREGHRKSVRSGIEVNYLLSCGMLEAPQKRFGIALRLGSSGSFGFARLGNRLCRAALEWHTAVRPFYVYIGYIVALICCVVAYALSALIGL